MKMKKFISLAAVVFAVLGMVSCAQNDNPFVVEKPAGPVYSIDYSTVDAYPFYRMAEPEGSSFDVIDGALVIKNDVERSEERR